MAESLVAEVVVVVTVAALLLLPESKVGATLANGFSESAGDLPNTGSFRLKEAGFAQVVDPDVCTEPGGPKRLVTDDGGNVIELEDMVEEDEDRSEEDGDGVREWDKGEEADEDEDEDESRSEEREEAERGWQFDKATGNAGWELPD
ncbi:unnamed protein product [Echinostoma caproni]|uniref:Uncharacterized protein n=1 Tax=Echinostoma caproni TaxID=27848 RepID=A0A3P8GKV9_9TREM|nr:unnamed protein product [Echinostoma caproni]